jgi:hypothetical protein
VFELRASCLLSRAGALSLEPLHQPFFVLSIFEIGSHFLPRLASTHDPPDLYLLSS